MQSPIQINKNAHIQNKKMCQFNHLPNIKIWHIFFHKWLLLSLPFITFYFHLPSIHYVNNSLSLFSLSLFTAFWISSLHVFFFPFPSSYPFLSFYHGLRSLLRLWTNYVSFLQLRYKILTHHYFKIKSDQNKNHVI